MCAWGFSCLDNPFPVVEGKREKGKTEEKEQQQRGRASPAKHSQLVLSVCFSSKRERKKGKTDRKRTSERLTTTAAAAAVAASFQDGSTETATAAAATNQLKHMFPINITCFFLVG